MRVRLLINQIIKFDDQIKEFDTYYTTYSKTVYYCKEACFAEPKCIPILISFNWLITNSNTGIFICRILKEKYINENIVNHN